MSSHPGCDLDDAIELACYLKSINHVPEQVQDFYPTPATISTTMYWTGLDPMTMKPVYVARDPHEKQLQRALMQFNAPRNYKLVQEALTRAGRTDLIGYGRHCLIPPVPWGKNEKSRSYAQGNGSTRKNQKPRKNQIEGRKAEADPTKKKNAAGRAEKKQNPRDQRSISDGSSSPSTSRFKPKRRG